MACAYFERIGTFPIFHSSRGYVSDSGLHPSPRPTRLSSFPAFAFSHYTTERMTSPYSGGLVRYRQTPSQQATIARLPEARIHLPLPACKPALPLTFGPIEWWKRRRFIRFAQNDNYTFLTFGTSVMGACISLQHDQAAGDRQVIAGNEAAVIRGDHQNRPGNVYGLAVTPQRCYAGHRFLMGHRQKSGGIGIG